jgi:hypothetical protein
MMRSEQIAVGTRVGHWEVISLRFLVDAGRPERRYRRSGYLCRRDCGRLRATVTVTAEVDLGG